MNRAATLLGLPKYFVSIRPHITEKMPVLWPGIIKHGDEYRNLVFAKGSKIGTRYGLLSWLSLN